MAKENLISKIFGNKNKKNQAFFSSGSVSMSSGSSFHLDERTILKIPEFYDAIDMISNDIAETKFYPTNVKWIDNDTLRINKQIKNSPWYNILNKKPNTYMSKIEFWKNNIFNLFFRDGFYLYIYRDVKGVVKELIPVDPACIRKVKKDSKQFYEITTYNMNNTQESKETVPYEDIIAVNYSDIERIDDAEYKYIHSTLLEQLGLKNQYDLQQLNTAPRILAKVTVPDTLEPEQKNKIKESMRTFFQSANKINNSAVLVVDPRFTVEVMNGDKTEITSPIDEKFSLSIMTKLANSLHIPLPKLNIVTTGQSFYKSREGINIDYLNDAIKPWLNKIVAKLNEIIYGSSTTKEFVFDIKSLLDVDQATRAEYSAKLRQNGIATTNELRVLNGFLPIEGGDKILGNGTLVDIMKPTEAVEPDEEAKPDEEKQESENKDE